MDTSGETKALSKYVTLVSSDGFEFVVLREAACISGAIKRMLDPKSGFSEATTGRCIFEEIKNEVVVLDDTHTLDLRLLISRRNLPVLEGFRGIVLEKVAEYFYYNFKYRNKEDVPDMEIPPELCLELLMAADYLDT
ncbi:putative Elongin-C [Halenospora varia]|nr:putative Elongin-C [Halenospora varia]